MSYCRWSCMNWQCDLYCYADVMGGWTTHVAAKRRVREPSRENDRWQEHCQKVFKHKDDDPLQWAMDCHSWTVARRAMFEELEEIPHESIGLPHDGETFNDPDLVSFLERVRYLKELGYKAPDYLEAAILEEMEEEGEVQP